MVAMNKVTILSALFFLLFSSLGTAGVVIIEDAKATKEEKADKQSNERDSSYSRDDYYGTQSKSSKDDKAHQKKPQNTNLIFGF